ncbi:MAG: AI-2E family transporter, partial [Armatimonadetes bacterium]|nr:AI-2E family transporter [Armatimonadota bacterium]
VHQAQWAKLANWGQQKWAQLPPDLQQWVSRQWAESQGASDLGRTVTEQLSHFVRRTLESGMVLVELILIPVLAFSFLTESRPLKRELVVLLPARRVKEGLRILRRAGIILQSYAVGQLILALIAGVVVWLLMIGLDIRYALALAVIAAVTRVIPVIGPLVGGVPIVLMSTLQGWERGVVVLVAFTILHLVESKVVMPRIIGYRIKLHPAVVIVVLLIGAEFFGMWGMFLAAPIAAVVRSVFHHFFVRPIRRTPPRGGSPEAHRPIRKGVDVERPAVAGLRRHSGAH